MVKKLFSTTTVQQHISNAYFLLLMVDQDINHSVTILIMILNLLFLVLFIELQEQHSYLNYFYMVILQAIYVALLWSENQQRIPEVNNGRK